MTAVTDQVIYIDPMDRRRLLLADGRPLLSIIGGGRERPFTHLELVAIAQRVVQLWNGDVAVGERVRGDLQGAVDRAREQMLVRGSGLGTKIEGDQ